MEEHGRGAAVEQLTARGMVSIPAMGGNSHTLYFEILLTSINPRDGGNRVTNPVLNMEVYINPRDGGAIAYHALRITSSTVSIPAMGGNSRNSLQRRRQTCINPRNGGQ